MSVATSELSSSNFRNPKKCSDWINFSPMAITVISTIVVAAALLAALGAFIHNSTHTVDMVSYGPISLDIAKYAALSGVGLGILLGGVFSIYKHVRGYEDPLTPLAGGVFGPFIALKIYLEALSRK